MSIAGDVWTAYCESSSGGEVDSFFLLANLTHCYESFSVFRQASYPSNVFNGLSLNNKNTVFKAERL